MPHRRQTPFGDWEDKIARVEKIDVPVYVVNQFNHFHSLGTLDAFRRISSKDKWLRISNEFEWPGNYTYRTRAQFQPDQDPKSIQGGFGLLNLNVGVRTRSGNVSVTGVLQQRDQSLLCHRH